ncbi:hypothetical protein D3867_34575 (plasmid) [Azospirillum argentinense]|uniref:Uncharacterized protein n=1 Tax=Azospirillum brasilense TaxID=192 RepID=A0A4D8QG27_AZOBR|nr:hypothetical protein D3867_34575 [Azospirillum argentinense]
MFTSPRSGESSRSASWTGRSSSSAFSLSVLWSSMHPVSPAPPLAVTVLIPDTPRMFHSAGANVAILPKDSSPAGNDAVTPRTNVAVLPVPPDAVPRWRVCLPKASAF